MQNMQKRSHAVMHADMQAINFKHAPVVRACVIYLNAIYTDYWNQVWQAILNKLIILHVRLNVGKYITKTLNYTSSPPLSESSK